MKPAEILAALSELGIELRVEDGQLAAYRPPDVVIPPDLAEAVRAHKAEIIRLLTEAAAPDRCPSCGAELSAGDLEKFGDCPKCRKTLPGWEDAPHPAGVVAVPKEPDPALNRALGRLRRRAELGNLEGYEADLAKAVLEAQTRNPRPWPFDGLEPAEWEALLAWAKARVPEPGPGPVSPTPKTAALGAKPERCPACGGTRFYQPWTGPHAGLWFCVTCNPSIRPGGEPFRSGPEALRDLANGIYVLARRHGFPELELYPGRKIGPGPEAWKEALRKPLEAGYEAQLWAILFGLEEATSPEAERAYTDRLLALAERLGYPELEADSRCPGPIRRIPAGGTAWAVAVVAMDPAERRYWLMRLKAEEGRGGPGA